jgi:inhibitor of KinA
MEKDYLLSPLGDGAVVVRFGQTIDPATHRRVMALAKYLDEHPLPGIIECVPAYTVLTIFYDPCRLNLSRPSLGRQTSTASTLSPYEILCSMIDKVMAEGAPGEITADVREPRLVEIPVCYGGEFGPDLVYVAEHNRLGPEEVVEAHAAPEYLVYMIGFAPGFPYLGGMSERRRAYILSRPRGAGS